MVCSECRKKYKTKGGFQRHIIAKHPEQSNNRGADEERRPIELTPDLLCQLVQSAVQKVTENEIFSESLRTELSSYSYEELQEGSAEFINLKAIFGGLAKNGDAEKFYGRFYPKICTKSTSFFKELSQHAATLLSTQLADCMLTYCKKGKGSGATESASNSEVILSEREKAGLQYVGGYVLHKLHKKHSKASSTESQQAMAVLKAGKLETDHSSSQKLISCLDRGGLWHITEHAQKVFSKTELYFRKFTSETGIQRVDIDGIMHAAMKDCDILENYNLILSAAQLKVDRHVNKGILDSIICLYVRVRSFSFAKDLIQRHKIKVKQASKAKSLRKDINRRTQANKT